MRAWSGEERGEDVMGPSVISGSAKSTSPPPLKNGNELRERGYLIAVGSKTARFRRKHKDKILLIILGFLMTLLLLLAITMTVLYIKSLNKIKGLCDSKECLRSAANLAISMNRSADPCENFYEYVCGNWALSHPSMDLEDNWFQEKQNTVMLMIRDVLSRNRTDHPQPVQQAVNMYRACLNIENLDKLGLKPILDVLDKLGLPQIPTYLNVTEDFDYESYSFNWLEAVIKVKTYMGMDVIIGFDIIRNPSNFSSYSLIMGSPETTDPFPSMNYKRKELRSFKRILKSIINDKVYELNLDKDLDDEKSERVFKLYFAEVMKRVFVESGGAQLANLSEAEIDENILKASNVYIDTYKQFFKFENSNSTSHDDDDVFDFLDDDPEYTAEDIQKITDEALELVNKGPIPIWKTYLTGVFNISDVELDFDSDKILVYDEDLKYLIDTVVLIAETPPVVLELYIWMQVVEVMVVHTTSELQRLHQRRVDEYYETLESGVPARSLLCARVVNEMLGMAVAYAILDNSQINVTKPKVETMLNEIKNALSRLVGRAKWMDDNTKVATYEKIDHMKTLIGIPDWLHDEKKLEEYYCGLELDSELHLDNLLNTIQVRVKKVLNNFRKPNNYTWATEPTHVNAYHSFQENAIIIILDAAVPLVMLQYPFYNLGLESLNYGSLGTVIGHEITHGFDNYGRHFNKDGYFRQWWSNETITSFVNMTHCFIDQYSSFYLPEVDKYIDGKTTLAENIADNGGVREAFAAFREHLWKHGREKKLPGFEEMTSEQLFFLSYENLWCGTSTEESLKSELEDSHSPLSFRARGALQNMKEFAHAWKCKPGSKMNPNKRCIIF